METLRAKAKYKQGNVETYLIGISDSSDWSTTKQYTDTNCK